MYLAGASRNRPYCRHTVEEEKPAGKRRHHTRSVWERRKGKGGGQRKPYVSMCRCDAIPETMAHPCGQGATLPGASGGTNQGHDITRRKRRITRMWVSRECHLALMLPCEPTPPHMWVLHTPLSWRGLHAGASLPTATRGINDPMPFRARCWNSRAHLPVCHLNWEIVIFGRG